MTDDNDLVTKAVIVCGADSAGPVVANSQSQKHQLQLTAASMLNIPCPLPLSTPYIRLDQNRHATRKCSKLRCIESYSRRLGAPQNICHPKLQYADTSYWWQKFILTEFTSSSINNHCLDSKRQDWLHCLTWLTNCQHSHVSSTHAHANALRCALKPDSLTCHNITYFTRDRSHFCVMTLTFYLMTFNVGSKSAVTWPNHVPILDKKNEKSAAKFTRSILNVWLSLEPLGEVTALS